MNTTNIVTTGEGDDDNMMITGDLDTARDEDGLLSSPRKAMGSDAHGHGHASQTRSRPADVFTSTDFARMLQAKP